MNTENGWVQRGEKSISLLREDATIIIKAYEEIWIRMLISNRAQTNISIFHSNILLLALVLEFESFWKMAASKSHTDCDSHHSGTKYISNCCVNSFFPYLSFAHTCTQFSLSARKLIVCVFLSTQPDSQHMHVWSLLMNQKSIRDHVWKAFFGIVLLFLSIARCETDKYHHWNVDELNYVRSNSKESIWPIVRLSL